MEKRFVVIGGDAARMSAASRIRKRLPDSRITVLESGNYVSYSACGMPFHIGGIVNDFGSLIHYPVEKFVNERRIDVRIGHRVTGIDREGRTVEYTNGREKGRESYDRLVIATGARPKIPEELHGIKRVHTLRTLDDLVPFEDSAQRANDITIIGAGYIGLELSEALRNRGKRVRVIQHSDTVLRGFDRELAATVLKELSDNGVEVHLNSVLTNAEMDGDKIRLETTDGFSFSTDMVAAATGVRPNSEIAAEAGLEIGTSGAILVDDHMRTSDVDIYAAGDVATTFNRITGARTYMPLATGSNRSGRVAGENAAGGDIRYAGITGTEVVKVFSLEVGKTGLDHLEASRAGFDPVSVTITSTSRSTYYPDSAPLTVKLTGDRRKGIVLGANMIGREGVAKRIDVVAAALASGMTVRELADVDYSYSPPFAPAWEPLGVAADVLLGKL